MKGVIGSDGGVTFENGGVKFCCEGLFGSGVTFGDWPRRARDLDMGRWKGGYCSLVDCLSECLLLPSFLGKYLKLHSWIKFSKPY